jgi:hypothetical protein
MLGDPGLDVEGDDEARRVLGRGGGEDGTDARLREASGPKRVLHRERREGGPVRVGGVAGREAGEA